MKLLKLVKEIRNKAGDLYFQRFALIERDDFSVYIHHILRKDEDDHLHDHPWPFWGIVLWGTYVETIFTPATKEFKQRIRHPLTFGFLPSMGTYHKILDLVSKDVWTLVITGKRQPTWGYWIPEQNYWVESSEYRQLKHQGMWGNSYEEGDGPLVCA